MVLFSWGKHKYEPIPPAPGEEETFPTAVQNSKSTPILGPCLCTLGVTMALLTAPVLYLAFSVGSLSGRAAAGSLADIDHVVLFMQENRAFDHYFGTMAGVRGFSDPNVQVNAGNKPVWYQDVDKSLSTATTYLLPWYLNYLGGEWIDATQCMTAGDNGWNDNHAALNGDLNNKWALNNTPWSWGYYKRSDLPVHFGIAEGWTVGDMYQESVISSTNPNRVTWASGSINAPGSPQSPNEGGMYIDNNVKNIIDCLFAEEIIFANKLNRKIQAVKAQTSTVILSNGKPQLNIIKMQA
jgi:phospholipase C